MWLQDWRFRVNTFVVDIIEILNLHLFAGGIDQDFTKSPQGKTNHKSY